MSMTTAIVFRSSVGYRWECIMCGRHGRWSWDRSAVIDNSRKHKYNCPTLRQRTQTYSQKVLADIVADARHRHYV